MTAKITSASANILTYLVSFILIQFKILASSVVGSTAEEDEANDDESQASGQPQIPKENCYEVVGTLQDPSQQKPEWVEDVFEVCALGVAINLYAAEISVNRFLFFASSCSPLLEMCFTEIDLSRDCDWLLLGVEILFSSDSEQKTLRKSL